MAVRPIDANELYRIEKLLDTDIVRQDKVALNLLEQVLYDIQHVPTLTPPNEWVKAMEAINNAAVAYIEGGPYENDLPGMEFALKIDRLHGILCVRRRERRTHDGLHRNSKWVMPYMQDGVGERNCESVKSLRLKKGECFMKKEELKVVLENHKKWLNGNKGGLRADLRYADLRGADLQDADLRGADLRYADLRYADLRGADLRYADLRYADLRGADLRGADLQDADLQGANLRGADLTNVVINNNTSYIAMQCPEEGSYIGFKKCCGNLIVKLRIPEDAVRSSATSRKCRASKAEVLSITNIDGSDANVYSVASGRTPDFVYTIGETVEVKNFDTDRWNECSTGIHHFLTRVEAVNYSL